MAGSKKSDSSRVAAGSMLVESRKSQEARDMASGQRLSVGHFLRSVAAEGSAAALADGPLLARFSACHDEAAFAALVRRHGPMVVGVCRRILGDWHAAEDAFQATFLVLARKAGSLRRPERLAAWLHGVARRTALKARTAAARRRVHERRLPVAVAAPPEDLAWRELRPVLDEEVGRLPARYRTAFVLCYLEGKTNAEAARLLGCSRGSVATLLARARARLRRRLGGRGLDGMAPLAAVPLCPGAIRSVVLLVSGKVPAARALVPAALAKGVVQSMLLNKIKWVAVFVLAALAAGGGGLAVYRVAAEEPPRAQPVPERPIPVQVQTLPPVVDPPEARDDRQATVRTDHFIVTAPGRNAAEQVAAAAERLRKDLALLWLGKELPDWAEPCPITVKSPPAGFSGATSFAFDNGKVLQQHMHLEGSLDRILADVLPHEMTHVILAHWARRPLPRWADEGAAVLSESVASRAYYDREMGKLLDRGGNLPLRGLLSQMDFPREVMALFVQGHSLTDMLVRQGGRDTFLEFLDRGHNDGWDKAANACYRYKSVEAMEAEWLAAVRKSRRSEKPPAEAAAESNVPVAKGRLPAGPAPNQALVILGKDGKLRVWMERATDVYIPHTDFSGPKPVTSYQLVSRLQETHYRFDEVRVFNMKGKPVDRKKLPGLLAEETLALVSADDKPVDPLHLRLYKEGTLLFVLPPPVARPVPPVEPDPAGFTPAPEGRSNPPSYPTETLDRDKPPPGR
jgi:RNA polymerase sigma factor (sigma-70 family)